jgi:K+/H+ antiporter YhaU regulatory subunit KhtT
MDPGTVNATRFLEILWHTVEGDSELRGRTLQELQLRTRFGVSVVAAIRSEEFIATPRADFAVQEGDLLALLGSGAQLKSFRSQVREQRVAQG